MCCNFVVEPKVGVNDRKIHPDIRLVHAPAVIGWLQVAAQAPLQFGRVSLDPSPRRDVIGVQSPLG
jgi:hypothetical protein